MRRPLPRLARLAAHVAPAPNRAAAVELLEDEELLAPMTAAGLGEELQPLLDSAPALEDTALLRERLNDDGYLFLRGFHERADVMAARTELLEPPDEGAEGGKPDGRGNQQCRQKRAAEKAQQKRKQLSKEVVRTLGGSMWGT